MQKTKRCRNKFERDLGKYRYAELRNFCLQYPEKRKLAESYLSPHSPNLDRGSSRTNSVTDITLTAVQKREKLLKDCELIEECARAVADGAFYKALILNTCMGKAYDFIPQEIMPTANRNAYFHARRQFFQLLDVRKG